LIHHQPGNRQYIANTMGVDSSVGMPWRLAAPQRLKGGREIAEKTSNDGNGPDWIELP